LNELNDCVPGVEIEFLLYRLRRYEIYVSLGWRC